ncbi:MAG: hypothetical protein CXT64_02910 [Methanobacteriota archaeon]|nr:MAG: hypothetical protein CXT64_02910 [Euryarchaeota archaeon]
MASGILHIYVDGSCEENRNVTADTPAGWGFCVVSGDTGLGRGRGDILHEVCGPVVTRSGSEGYLGAEVGSNNTAELSAIAQATRWLLESGEEQEVVIRSDSQYALNIASGEWRAKKNKSGTRSAASGNSVVNTSGHIADIVGTNARTTLLSEPCQVGKLCHCNSGNRATASLPMDRC